MSQKSHKLFAHINKKKLKPPTTIVPYNKCVSLEGTRTIYRVIPGISDFSPKLGGLAPNGTNPGLFQIRFLFILARQANCTEIWSEQVPVWFHLGPENCHLNVKNCQKLPTFFSKQLPKIVIFFQKVTMRFIFTEYDWIALEAGKSSKWTWT